MGEEMIYVVLWEDRQSDVTAHAFSSEAAAISEARRIARKCADASPPSPLSYVEHECNACDDWLFDVSYCGGAGTLRVVPVELDAPIK